MEFSRQGYWRMGSHSFSRGSFWPRDWTWLSCLADRFFSIWASRNRISWCLQFCRPAPLPSIYSLLQVRSQPLQRWKLQALSVCHPRSVIWFLVWVLYLSDSEPAEAGQGITTLTHTLTHHHTPLHTHTHTHHHTHTHPIPDCRPGAAPWWSLVSRQGGVGEDRVLETQAVQAWFWSTDTASRFSGLNPVP